MKIKLTEKLESSIKQAEDVVNVLNEIGFKNEANALSSQIKDIKDGKFYIGLVGLAKRGKSTLLNGMLGRRDDKIAPVDKYPATNVISLFSSGDDEQALVVNENGEKKLIGYNDVRMYTCEEYNPGNHKNVISVEVTGKFPGLEPGVFLVDTPGCGNTLSKQHSALLYNFLPRADALIFLVTAGSPIGEEELELIENIQKNSIKKVFLALNKIDLEDEEDIRAALIHNKKILESRGLSQVEIYPISARQYFETGVDSGVENLLAAICDLISKEKVQILQDRLDTQSGLARENVARILQTELELSTKSSEALRYELENLKTFETTLQSEFPGIANKFIEECRELSESFIPSITGIKKAAYAEIEKIISNTGSLSLASKSKTLHVEVQHIVEKMLRPRLLKWEEGFVRAVQDLDSDIKSKFRFSTPDVSGSIALKRDLVRMISIGAAGIGPSILASVTILLPGIVGKAFSHFAAIITADAVKAAAGFVWWNPLTWGSAVTTAALHTSAGSLATAGALVTGTLAAASAVVTPLLFGWAGYRIFSSYRENYKIQQKDLTIMACKMIDDYFDDIYDMCMTMSRNVPKEIIREVKKLNMEQVDHFKRKIGELQVNSAKPGTIQQLESQLKLIDGISDNSNKKIKSNIDW